MNLTTFYFMSTILVFMWEQAYSASIAAPETKPGPPHRVKRCSCENLKDVECVYFCHIGIVWVNTPSQVVSYGMGSFPARLRRDASRCICADGADQKCQNFCTVQHVPNRHLEKLSSSSSRRRSKRRSSGPGVPVGPT